MKKALATVCIGLLALAGSITQAAPLGTAFTYQGRLEQNGQPATNGIYGMRFALHDVDNGGAFLGTNLLAVPVTNGLFTANVDFGATAFTGDARWLEVGVNTNAPPLTPAYQILLPRTRLAPTPNALYASTAGTATNVVSGAVVKSLNGLRDAISLVAGPNITLTPSGNSLTVASTGGPGLWSLNGSSAYYNAGNVGIGTATPDRNLTLASSSGAQYMNLKDGTREILLGVDGGGGILSVMSGHDLILRAGGNSEKVRIAAGGNVGIGTTTPGAKLHVVTASGNGVASYSASSTDSGVYGENNGQGYGVAGRTTGTGLAVYGDNQNPNGWAGVFDGKVLARPNSGVGLQANSQDNNGVFGLSISSASSGVYGQNDGQGYGIAGRTGGAGVAVYGDNRNPAGWAGVFAGNVMVDGYYLRASGLGDERAYIGGDGAGGDVQVGSLNPGVTHVALFNPNRNGGEYMHLDMKSCTIYGSDFSERFDIAESEGAHEPGKVVCIDPAHPGKLLLSSKAYDSTVAGIISGAGGVKPGIFMGQPGTLADGQHPVALSGRVYVKADASFGAIKPGDLLTTSDTPGHAMKVTDHAKAQGAILGKAMSALHEGTGLVLVLVTLQ